VLVNVYSCGQWDVNFSPAASAEATRAFRRELRRWHLPTRSDTSLEDLSRMCNPVLRGWVNYDSRFYQSALYPTFQHLARILMRWALRKYQRLRGHQRRAEQAWRYWLRRRSSKRAIGWETFQQLLQTDVLPTPTIVPTI